MIAAASRAGSWWWALSGSTTSSRMSRGTGADDGGQRSATACGAPSTACGPGRAAGRLLASTMSTSVGVVWSISASTWSARSKPVVSPVLGRHVADEDARGMGARDRVADRGDEQARQEARVQAARPEDDELGLGDGGQGVVGRADVLGRQPDAIDPGRAHDLRLAVDDRAVGQPGVEGQRRRRDRDDLATDGEDAVHQAGCRPRSRRPRPRSSRRSAGSPGRGRPGRRPRLRAAPGSGTGGPRSSAARRRPARRCSCGCRRPAGSRARSAARPTSRRRRPRSRSRSGCWCAP